MLGKETACKPGNTAVLSIKEGNLGFDMVMSRLERLEVVKGWSVLGPLSGQERLSRLTGQTDTRVEVRFSEEVRPKNSSSQTLLLEMMRVANDALDENKGDDEFADQTATERMDERLQKLAPNLL